MVFRLQRARDRFRAGRADWAAGEILGDWPLAIGGPLFVSVGMTLYTATAWWPTLALLLVARAINAAGRSFQQPTISSLISKFSDSREQGVTFGSVSGARGACRRVAGPILAGAVYPFLRNAGAFAVSAIIVLLAGVDIALRRPLPGQRLPMQWRRRRSNMVNPRMRTFIGINPNVERDYRLMGSLPSYSPQLLGR